MKGGCDEQPRLPRLGTCNSLALDRILAGVSRALFKFDPSLRNTDFDEKVARDCGLRLLLGRQ
ncbi:hypothetical protein AJ87_47600 [Rhizobium yanglingense]|nr:hypothetical protein AJ87_47600 [Rhizobium yanglingense]